MTIKGLLGIAAEMLGEKDVSGYLEGNVPDDSAYCEDTTALLKRCYDVVADELACEYFPLKKTECFDATDGQIEYSDFSEKPVGIESVCDEKGNKLPYKAVIDRLNVYGHKVFVTYRFKPRIKALDDDADFADGVIGEYAICYGIATEFCIERGRLSDAELWNGKYDRALRGRLAERRKLKIRARKWC